VRNREDFPLISTFGRLFAISGLFASMLILSGSSLRADITYVNTLDGPTDRDGFVNMGGNFATITAGSDMGIAGGGANTVRTGFAGAEFAATSTAVPAGGTGTLTFAVSQRIRDRESFASIVNASGTNLLSIGNTNGTDALANNQDPGEFRIYGFDGTGEVLIDQFDATGTLAISGGSYWGALQLTVDLVTGAYTYEGENLSTAAAPPGDPTGAFTTIGTGFVPTVVIAELSNATGIGAGQSGGGTGFDDFSVNLNITAVPEPSSLALLGVVTCFGMIRRRRS